MPSLSNSPQQKSEGKQVTKALIKPEVFESLKRIGGHRDQQKLGICAFISDDSWLVTQFLQGFEVVDVILSKSELSPSSSKSLRKLEPPFVVKSHSHSKKKRCFIS
jgi:hypothetical protein